MLLGAGLEHVVPVGTLPILFMITASIAICVKPFTNSPAEARRCLDQRPKRGDQSVPVPGSLPAVFSSYASLTSTSIAAMARSAGSAAVRMVSVRRSGRRRRALTGFSILAVDGHLGSVDESFHAAKRVIG